MHKNLLIDHDWSVTKTTWCSWWEGRLSRPLVVIEARDLDSSPVYTSAERHLTQYDLTVHSDEVLTEIEHSLSKIHWMGDAFPRWWPNFGAGILAGCLGSPVHFVNETTWFYPVDAPDLCSIPTSVNPNNAWYRRMLEITHLAVERWGDQVCIGIADLGGNLDILASLRSSQQLLVDLVDQPQQVERLAQSLTAVWLEVFDELSDLTAAAHNGFCGWGPLWMPAKGYMLQSDLSYMISPRMFKRFVVPDLEACCAHMDFGFYHLDGAGEIRHLDLLLTIPGLRGIQWIPGDGAPPPEEWLDLLRRIRAAGKLCQVYVTPGGAQKIVRELGGEGFIFSLWEDAPSGHRDLTPQEGEAALNMFAREGVNL
jgi:hypothetical protein